MIEIELEVELEVEVGVGRVISVCHLMKTTKQWQIARKKSGVSS